MLFRSKIFPLFATSSIQATDTSWVSGAITFDQTLPVGKYDIVGMRVTGSGLVVARLIFIGSSAITRPGVPCTDSNARPNFPNFRMGNNGLFGTFDTSTPPSIEVFGGSSSSQSIVFDLIKRS